MIGLGGAPVAPRRWEAVEGQPVPALEHSRDELRKVLRALNPGRGPRAMVRMAGSETWRPERAGPAAMPTSLIRQLVEGGYAAVTNATETTEAGGSRWVAVPCRVMATGKGLERR